MPIDTSYNLACVSGRGKVDDLLRHGLSVETQFFRKLLELILLLFSILANLEGSLDLLRCKWLSVAVSAQNNRFRFQTHLDGLNSQLFPNLYGKVIILFYLLIGVPEPFVDLIDA